MSLKSPTSWKITNILEFIQHRLNSAYMYPITLNTEHAHCIITCWKIINHLNCACIICYFHIKQVLILHERGEIRNSCKYQSL